MWVKGPRLPTTYLFLAGRPQDSTSEADTSVPGRVRPKELGASSAVLLYYCAPAEGRGGPTQDNGCSHGSVRVHGVPSPVNACSARPDLSVPNSDYSASVVFDGMRKTRPSIATRLVRQSIRAMPIHARQWPTAPWSAAVSALAVLGGCEDASAPGDCFLCLIHPSISSGALPACLPPGLIRDTQPGAFYKPLRSPSVLSRRLLALDVTHPAIQPR